MKKIQNKIWLLTTVILFIMAVIWISLTVYNQKTQEQYNEILQRYLHMNEVTIASGQMITDLNNFLLTPSQKNLEQLDFSKEKIKIAQNQITILKNTENDFVLTNYMNLIDSLLETTDRTLSFHSEKETEAASKEFTEATQISMYISETTLTLLDKEIKTYDHFYRGIIQQSVELKKMGVWLFLLMTFILIFLTYWFSLSITRPVKELTEAANELSKGRFDRKIKVDSNDEISFLAKTFERMRINIIHLIAEIQEKAQLERELQQNKLLLKESQLRSLQSQINPHFLYNTLNTLSKKAYLEGSVETSELLVNVAGMLRYNLKQLDSPVTLAEEVKVLKQYLEIQLAGFTDRLRTVMDIDEACLHVRLPGLTLQPIIENAVIHGVEPNEDGGTIVVRVIGGDKHVFVEIEDEGPGMAEEKIKHILEGRQVHTEGHSTGIGFSNVVKRSRLFCGTEDVIEIVSSVGKGTKVILKIPMNKEKKVNDQTPNRR